LTTIKWLHLSDFHVGLDNYGQTQIFKYILQHIEERKAKQGNLDFVFITGDIAQSGLEKEYEKFGNEFITPLKNILSKECKIFVVSGNHDVDRKKFKIFSPEAARNIPDFFDPTPAGLENRQDILDLLHLYKTIS
jgi:DNA repair exonuclease SbcCD nuclease subunit